MASSLISTCRRTAWCINSMSDAVLEHVLRRDRAIVITALTALTALAWTYTIWLAGTIEMGGVVMSKASAMSMNMGAVLAPVFKPWTGVDFVVMFVMWTVMMVGMMTPSAAPMILLYARVGRQAALQGKPLATTGFFAGGYLLAWTTFSLAATVGQWLLERAALLTHMMVSASDVLGAMVLITAGVFQWTPVKDACLKHCQSPLSFILEYGFRHGIWGSLSIGFRHGIFCVGCCWALMALLFVGGVMNIIWIAALTIFVLLEKVVPLGRIISRTAGVALLVWGVWLLIAG
jgi:predicted metal-binding membrane protein